MEHFAGRTIERVNKVLEPEVAFLQNILRRVSFFRFPTSWRKSTSLQPSETFYSIFTVLKKYKTGRKHSNTRSKLKYPLWRNCQTLNFCRPQQLYRFAYSFVAIEVVLVFFPGCVILYLSFLLNRSVVWKRDFGK